MSARVIQKKGTVRTKDPAQYPVVLKFASLKSSMSEKQKEFGASLVKSFNTYGRLTPRQFAWVERLIKELTTEPKEHIACSNIVDFFDKAGQNLKRMKVQLMTSTGQKVIFKRKNNESYIQVTGDAYPSYFGYISSSNKEFRADPAKAEDDVLDLIRRFNADPEGTVTMYGKTSGNCSFCSHPLDDKRSLGVGYGPICAKKWGLPWGTN